MIHKENLDELRQAVKGLRGHVDGGAGPVRAQRAFDAVRELAEQ